MAAPLFLLAPPRSFTSVINAMIGQHPQVFAMPELNLFNVDYLVDIWYPPSSEVSVDGKPRHGLLRAVAEIYAGEQTDDTIEFAEHWCAARQHLTTGEIYRELQAKLDPLIPLEKSPSYTIEMSRMERILGACPDARFIHLLRHPIKQCESVVDLSDGVFSLFVNSIEYQADRALAEPQIAWHDMNINIMNFLEQKVPTNQYIRLRGEDLLADPEPKLKEICRWLKIRDDNEAMDAMMRPERSPFACLGPILALFGNDPKFLKGPTFRKHVPKTPPLETPVKWRDDGKGLYPEVIALAREFGYR
jgi:hypothetical protein